MDNLFLFEPQCTYFNNVVRLAGLEKTLIVRVKSLASYALAHIIVLHWAGYF